MFDFLKKKDKRVDQRRPTAYERVTGRLGYDREVEGRPALEFLAELAPPEGLHRYRKMKMNDPIVGGLLLQIENIIRRLKWDVQGENADFVSQILKDLPGGVQGVNYEMSSAFCYGFYIGEQIWKMEDNRLILVDIAPRFQPSIHRINDVNGNVRQLTQQGTFDIPYSKCVHHMYFTENRAPYGTSILRHLYKPYYYKVSVEASEAVGIDRDLSGLPMMTAPEGFDFEQCDHESPNYDPAAAATLEWALNTVSNVRKDTTQGIVKPYGWELELIRGENRTNIPTNDIISRYNTEMAAGVLENFISLGAFATTNNANTEVNVRNFLRACDAYAEIMSQTYNEQIIEPICRFNNINAPQFSFTPVNTDTLGDLATFFARLVSNGIVTPTTTLEKELLQIADFTYDPDNVKPPQDGEE